MGICHPSTIVPRQVYDRVGLYDERYYISADVDFAIRCYRAGVKIVNIQSILTNMSDGGISNQLPLRKNLHEAQKFENKNESSTDNITKINEQLVEAGCGTQQINE